MPRSARNALYFDFETIPDYDRLDSFGLDPVPEPKPLTPAAKCPTPAGFLADTAAHIKSRLTELNPAVDYCRRLYAVERDGKKRSTVIAHIRAASEGGNTSDQAKADRRKLLSTTPEFCKIAAFGWAVAGDEVYSDVLSKEMTEVDLLVAFWGLVQQYQPLIGFNILGFDLPVVFFRSAILGVKPTKFIDTKPWGKDVIDLYAKRFPSRSFGSGRPAKLKELAPLAGIDVPAGDVDGSQVEELMESDEGRTKVGEYVRSDVEITRQLHWFYSGYFCE